MNKSLPNYLRSFRQRAHLTQDEVAYLMGLAHGTTVLRHEESQRLPQFSRLFHYAAIFHSDPRELFAGHYEKIEAGVRERAHSLLLSLAGSTDVYKLDFLNTLANSPDVYFVPCDDQDE
jgi:transcriptional regulator with XRE-family HTH domain